MTNQKIIGILGFHGSREEHAEKMISLGYVPRFLRIKEDFENLCGIILPGGESTSFGRNIQWSGLEEPLKEAILIKKIPTFGTCAGAILLSRSGSEFCIGAIDVDIKRNAYGSQKDSFITNITLKEEDLPFSAIFIRAPQISHCEDHVQILATYKNIPILVTANHILLSTFHPELRDDNRVHKIFDQIIKENGKKD